MYSCTIFSLSCANAIVDAPFQLFNLNDAILPKSMHVIGIETVSRNGGTGLGVLGTYHFGKSIETADGTSDCRTKGSQYTRDHGYRFDQTVPCI